MTAELIHVSRADLSVTRCRSGKGFRYVDADGTTIKDPEFRARAAALGIPPAWTEVHLALDPLAHIQACGTDGAGRVQYIYHPDWEERRTERKTRKLTKLAALLPRLRRRIEQDLHAPAGSQELALAIAAALIDRTAMRVGQERYLKSRGTRGAATLLKRDIRIIGDCIRIKFPAKSGKEAEYTLRDRALGEAIRRIKAVPGARLLNYRSSNGAVHHANEAMINCYLREAAGAEITAKDFRTLHASAMAGEELASVEPATSERVRKRQVAEVTRKVADYLRNTPAISRKSYIAPGLISLFNDGRLQRMWRKPDAPKPRLRRREFSLGSVLKKLR